MDYDDDWEGNYGYDELEESIPESLYCDEQDEYDEFLDWYQTFQYESGMNDQQRLERARHYLQYEKPETPMHDYIEWDINKLEQSINW